jgi:hypothetical protein
MTEKVETKSFVMYDSFFEAAQDLEMDYKAFGEFVVLLRNYAVLGKESRSKDGRVNALLATAKPQVKASTNRWKKAVKGGDDG